MCHTFNSLRAFSAILCCPPLSPLRKVAHVQLIKIIKFAFGLTLLAVVSGGLTCEPLLAESDGESRSPHVVAKANRYGGDLVWGVYHQPTIINPVLTTHSISMNLLDLIFNRLVRINSRGEWEPDLAREWTVSADGLIYRFLLRQGVMFHDGEECTAEDVKFTFEQLLNPQNNSPFLPNFSLVKELRVVDEYTFEVVLSEPNPLFINKIAYGIMPRHLLMGKDLAEASFNEFPIGTGPFRFVSWDKADGRIKLAAFDDYFEGRPYLDQVIVAVYQDSAQLFSALMRNEVDLVQFIRQADFELIRKDEHFNSYSVDLGFYCAMVYNLGDPLLSQIEIRQAIAHAINRGELLSSLTDISGVVSEGPFRTRFDGWESSRIDRIYNPTKSNILLNHRGWIDHDNDGTVEKSGKSLTLKLLVDERSPVMLDIAAQMRQQLSQVGIKLNLVRYNNDEQLTASFLREHGVQAWLRFFAGYDLRDFEVADDWSSSSGQVGRLWEYRNSQLDALLTKVRLEKNDETRNRLFQQIHQVIIVEQPVCFLFYPISYSAIRDNLEGVESYFSRFMPTYEMKDWYWAE